MARTSQLTGQFTEQSFTEAREEGTAERAILLWIGLYALIVTLLVGQQVFGRGMPLIDNFGRSALMAPETGIELGSLGETEFVRAGLSLR